jgi:beta-mannosidase
VPRDRGATWDFEDVRDHYLGTTFHVDPVRLRRDDPERYLRLSRLTSGIVMADAMAEWRRPGSGCRGALVWLLRDPMLGAGWGLVDATGAPKAAWYFLRRACAPLALLATDEGLNGIALHACNDGGVPVDGTLEIALWRDGATRVGEASSPLALGAHEARTLSVDALLGRFTDSAYAYRFGPPGFDVMTAVLRAPASHGRTGAVLAETCMRVGGWRHDATRAPYVEALASRAPDGGWRLTLRSPRFAPAVAIEVEGYTLLDNHVDLVPGGAREVVLMRTEAGSPEPRGQVRPLDALAATPIEVVVAVGDATPSPSEASWALR